MQKDPLPFTSPLLNTGATRPTSVSIPSATLAAATPRATANNNLNNSPLGNGVYAPPQSQSLPPTQPTLRTPTESFSVSAFRRRSLCSIDQPGVVMTRLPQELEDTQHEFGSKLVVIMVGLPARGKSYLVKKLQRYLTWLQYDTKVFNVGNRRRIASKGDNRNGTSHSHAFFDPKNTAAKEIRDELALESLEELIAWLKQGGRVGIHDATNSSRERRKLLLNRLEQEPNCRVLFIESICTDPVVLAHNLTMKLSSPDYKDMDERQAREDFRKRLENYERAYQTLGEEDEEDGIQYCKLINVGKKVIAYNIQGYLAGQCIFYLMNFNLSPRCIWLTRHGESVDNIVGKIGGDAPLSARGKRYGDCLSRFIQHQKKENKKSRRVEAEAGMAISPLRERTVAVWTSMLTRTKETVEGFDPKEYDIKHIRFLNEIYAGICEGLSYTEIEMEYPEEFEARRVNKLFYRYPGMGGESYLDVIQRLNPLIIELERMTSDLLIVTHRVVLRILLGYLMDIDRSKMPEMDVHLHTLYCVEPKPHGTVVRKYRWDEELDWFVEESVDK
ncbi:bifunctional 6-phosphofructo-2-kinase/fructose-2,6-bisphosphate 2-phosphatase [Linnemannia elongata AG-77]|uniref:Bifunctional 6-phosphofructo-2-kinase/fructose-2,6-bisphosphate 2-phosphatase n=1 Tax=Linnemannia elongata AG-77 TaxID=1314771 RepID=A0A197JPA2_9FUNG|nr:bifunctional 6-phosphofructo-2-kinase/fructose-2,6-bisphosphate 2-phosphatase [Linnemannia elongata AG-77]